MAHTVIGIFDHASDAQQAVNQLLSSGFSASNVDLSAASLPATGTEVIPDRHTNSPGTPTPTGQILEDTKDAGSGIGGFFSSLFGGDQDDTRKYQTVGNQGSIVTVHADTDALAEQAADILDEAGAVDVNERAAEYGYVATPGAAASPAVDSTGDTIQVIEEQLQVGKQTVETGGVRLRSRIVEKPVEENIRLRQERVIVQRTPVNRVATAADLSAFQGGQIELTEHAEVPVVSKTVKVVEEISVGKTVTEREEIIHDTVRKTEVDIETLPSTTPPARPAGSDADPVTYSAS